MATIAGGYHSKKCCQAAGGRVGGGRAIAALVHELVELGAVLGGAQPVEEVAELALLLVELAQRLLAIFVEGDVAAALRPQR